MQFFFFSSDPYWVVVRQLEHLNLGKLTDVYMHERPHDYHYVAHYEYFTCLRMIESMTHRTEIKLVYGENEHGYPLYWKLWW